MPDNEISSEGILVDKRSKPIDWNIRSDQDGMLPFPQTPSNEAGCPPAASPHDIFTFFTADIILQKKIFIR
jgi:hypothetical protein